ncbi:MAG: hypothetical protein JXO48_00555 [Deltaproteobacteria bacterium]|nr:hypothetical protein [Deltaproteobacteria bacterium]
MLRKLVIAILLFALMIPLVSQKVACAGGAGGEPLMSDAVGWGIVGALVIVGIYYVYTTKPEASSEKETPEDQSESFTPVKTDSLTIVTSQGQLIIAKW